MRMKLSVLFFTLLVRYAIPGGLTAAVGNHGPESSVNSEIHPPVESPTNGPLDPHATKHSTTGQGNETQESLGPSGDDPRSYYEVPNVVQCEATMHQPEADPGITVEEYQEALDNIPLDIKIAYSKYAWKFSEDQSLSWNYIFDPDKSGPGQAEQYLVPGTKEPYYLEGADTGAARSGIPPPLLELR
ncbi:hypothetical protein TWF703_008983 [Orbilia oligospora]|uniref:Uncharacterized protein n=1 Tax=Orbilia oligospora TaxID=2813651 RepID=A0A7C8JKU8_ORBOL|nr:hypothetical protein TWF703_008983 [Orbilia oligospora]